MRTRSLCGHGSIALLFSWINQRYAEFRSIGPHHSTGIFLNHYFERRPHQGFNQVPAFRLTVTHSQNHMQMKNRTALFAQSAITQQAEYLALLVKFDPVIVLSLKVEKSKRSASESSNRGHRGCR